MARQYVASTPATRGEVEEGEDVTEDGLPADMTEDEVRALLEEAAAKLGLRLVPIESEGDDQDGSGDDSGDNSGDDSGAKPAEEPAGNATTEAWATYAVSKGASEDDLKGDDGEPLGRDELRAKYGTPAS